MSSPYSKDAQIFTFGVHGTANEPSNVREVARRISVGVGETTDGANLFDNGFSWKAKYKTIEYTDENGLPKTQQVPERGTSYLGNDTKDREIASQRLASHVLQQVDKAIERGTLDRDKPLTINLVGFSHGGNVAILASDEISEGLKRRGIESAIHLTTLSTPAYTWGKESPLSARDLVQADGVKFAHTHFSTPGDGVIRAALGNANYDNGVTRDYNFTRGVSAINGIANHGAVQDRTDYMDAAASIMRQRFNGLAPAQTRASISDDIQVAGISRAMPTLAAHNGAASWDAFNQNTTVQQVSAALFRAVPDVQREDQNPSLLAGLAGAAATQKMAAVRDIAFTPDQQTAFLSDRDKSDPSAKLTPVGTEFAHKPFNEVWQKAEVALQANQNAPTLALNSAQETDITQKQSARSLV